MIPCIPGDAGVLSGNYLVIILECFFSVLERTNGAASLNLSSRDCRS